MSYLYVAPLPGIVEAKNVTLILEIAAGVVLGLFAFSVLQVIFAWVLSEFRDIWDEIRARPWALWTLGFTVFGCGLLWLLGRK